MEASHTLWEYAEYTERVRQYTKELPIEEAVERAITECIQEGILKEFLEGNRREAKNMSIYEYDQEKHLRQEREAAWEEGQEWGRENKLEELIQKKLAKGKSVPEIAEALEEEENEIRRLILEMEERKSSLYWPAEAVTAVHFTLRESEMDGCFYHLPQNIKEY